MRPPAGVPNKATAMPMTSQMAGAQMQPMASPTPMMQQLSFALSHHAVSMRHRVRPQSVLEVLAPHTFLSLSPPQYGVLMPAPSLPSPAGTICPRPRPVVHCTSSGATQMRCLDHALIMS